MTSPTRAQRLVDEFHEGASWEGGFNPRRGLAWVLRHIADTEAGYADSESFYAIPPRTLEALADDLEAPTLLDRALAGDREAARQFLYEGGFTDAEGQLLPQLQPPQETNDQ